MKTIPWSYECADRFSFFSPGCYLFFQIKFILCLTYLALWFLYKSADSSDVHSSFPFTNKYNVWYIVIVLVVWNMQFANIFPLKWDIRIICISVACFTHNSIIVKFTSCTNLLLDNFIFQTWGFRRIVVLSSICVLFWNFCIFRCLIFFFFPVFNDKLDVTVIPCPFKHL